MIFKGGTDIMKKRIPMAILAIIILTALDQLVKHLISTNFQVGQTRKIIDGVFQLNYVQNLSLIHI